MQFRHSTLKYFLPVCVVLSAGAARAQETPPPPQVSVAKPVVRDVVDNDDFIGRFQASEQVSIRSRVGGYLQSINFKDGQLVKQGDELFEIDQRPFITAFNEATAQLAVASSTLTYAQSEFNRVNTLVKSGSQTVSTLDDRRRELQSAQANLQGSEASVERARLDLTYSKITAPLAGRINRHLISVGNLVQADQTELTTIVALDPIDFYFDVDERRLLNYAETARKNGKVLQEGGGGLKVSVRLGDRDQTKFSGTLNFAENTVDQATGTLRVRARFANPDFVLQPGLFGRVEIEGSNSYTAILIPDEAIAADQNERVVYVLNPDNTVTTKSVRPGPKLYGYRVIRSGLTGDEQIVVKGVVRVRPGAKVTPVTVQLPRENPNDVPATAQQAVSAAGAAQ
ncbi:efflux RND transporter periplasmic adaptor subunit [Rhizobium sp. P32RR-XVIII]|uniref:efflux RND transporter periplasmic adaptor subunit n=1 Tax=Rhizobium sp. P32RR-XVIII TaxID=2726738 RepID=UPI00145740E3|nr:efflux RND transporter periplasmic adaptor subunit [Rhizobium sp. P32RR-XVIII]NLS07425.1 efflux RND transporter periplasmic adaptor subunit [Rhizobium sp. P32RR-XVIII]